MVLHHFKIELLCSQPINFKEAWPKSNKISQMRPNPYLVVLRGVGGGGGGLGVVGRVLPLARHGHAAGAAD